MSVVSVIDCLPCRRADKRELIRCSSHHCTIIIMKLMKSKGKTTGKRGEDVWDPACCIVAWSRKFAQWMPAQVVDYSEDRPYNLITESAHALRLHGRN